jgi:hypothetical protein
MSGRATIFEQDEDDVDVGEFKPAASPRARDLETVAAVRQTAESKGFVSREATPISASPVAQIQPSPPAGPVPQEARLRRRRTGRDRQLNIKTTDECADQLYAIADGNGWGLGETLERAIALLKAQLAQAASA